MFITLPALVPLLLLGLVLAVAALVGSVVSLRAVVREREAELTTTVGTALANHGVWVGAWLVAIRASAASEVAERSREAALGAQHPEQIVQLWKHARGAVLTHLNGPPVSSEAQAHSWLQYAASALPSTAVPALAHPTPHRLFALLYASGRPPPAVPALDEIATFVRSCSGAAFVACQSGPAGLPDRGGLRSARLLQAIAWISGVLVMALVVGLVVQAVLITPNGAQPLVKATTEPAPTSAAQTATPVVGMVNLAEPAPPAAPGSASAKAEPSGKPAKLGRQAQPLPPVAGGNNPHNQAPVPPTPPAPATPPKDKDGNPTPDAKKQ